MRATFQQTRKVNGEQLQDRVKCPVGPWKAEKYMPVTLRCGLSVLGQLKFRHKLLHEILFTYYLLGKDSVPNPGFLMYLHLE